MIYRGGDRPLSQLRLLWRLRDKLKSWGIPYLETDKHLHWLITGKVGEPSMFMDDDYKHACEMLLGENGYTVYRMLLAQRNCDG